MARISRYARIASHLARTSIQAQAQYRVDFVIQILLAFFWVFWNVAPLWLIFEIRPDIAGWHFEEAMLVMSAFLILKAMLEGLITPNLIALVDHVRTGTLDFLLLKPVDAQLVVSVSRILPAKSVDFFCGVGIAVWSTAQLDPAPAPVRLLAGALMLLSGALSIYAIWMLLICSAFWFVKIDNLSYLFTSFFDAARWPIAVFRGWVRALLTFVLPIAVMTSYPAMALLGRLDAEPALGAAASTAALLVLSRLAWRFSLTRYSSASS